MGCSRKPWICNLTGAEIVLRGAISALRGRPDVVDYLGIGLRDLGNVLRDRGVLEDATSCFREAVTIFTRLGGETHVRVAETNAYFGRPLVRRGLFEEAEARLVHSLRSLRRSFGGRSSADGDRAARAWHVTHRTEPLRRG
jgi:hypothetical protein